MPGSWLLSSSPWVWLFWPWQALSKNVIMRLSYGETKHQKEHVFFVWLVWFWEVQKIWEEIKIREDEGCFKFFFADAVFRSVWQVAGLNVYQKSHWAEIACWYWFPGMGWQFRRQEVSHVFFWWLKCRKTWFVWLTYCGPSKANCPSCNEPLLLISCLPAVVADSPKFHPGILHNQIHSSRYCNINNISI